MTNTAIERPCTSTVTVGNGPATKTCGVPVTAYTSGSVSCPNNAPAGQSNQYFRIEGNDAVGTIFEGCIVAGPRSITTPSGGTHLCDGTQNNANPNPITTPTDMIDAAGRLIGFDFDGTYNTQFQDFFITRISTVAQTSNAFWGILDNYQFTPTGGCQYGAFPGSRILWAYDAFSRNAFLKVSSSRQSLTTYRTNGRIGLTRICCSRTRY